MSIKFILDNVKSNDLMEIQNIIKSLREKPIKNNQNAEFLKRFTLSMIDTFRKDKKQYRPEIKDIKIEVPEKFVLQPKIPEKLKLDLDLLNIPKKVDIPLELFLNAPRKVNVKIIEEAPSRELFQEAPSKELIKNAPERFIEI